MRSVCGNGADPRQGGAVIKILGTDLTGATNVTFNGTAAVFKAKTLISASVPSGATLEERRRKD